MQSNNIFNITRFGILCKQSLAHNYKLVLTSIVAFSGGLFILLLIIQFTEGFQPLHLPMKRYFGVFIIVFIIGGIITAGTAFPNLRTKEKAFYYLMIPASAFEKFLMEFLMRILLFILIIPLVYWVVYNLEGHTVNLFYPNFAFQGQDLFTFPDPTFPTATASLRVKLLSITGGLLLFTLPFTGATVFSKSPLIKTVFAVALIFFGNLFLVYFFLEIMGFNQYHPSEPILFIRHMEDGLLACIAGSIIFNAGFIAAAFFKLKEREV